MMPLFASPWALAALAAIPLLVAIYFFQRRFRSRDVSSLLLWNAIRDASMGGRTREPIRLPLAFWLELAVIALLALAAAAPFVARWGRSRPLVIVLDDSLSMRAARERASAAIREIAARGDHDPIHVVYAGRSPQLAAGVDLARRLEAWSCAAPSADLDAAIGFATQVGGPNALVLVATDHAPERTIDSGALLWRSFGEARPNAAFVAAARSGGARDRVLLEIAGYGASRATLTVTAGNRVLQRSEVALRPDGRTRVQLDAGAPNEPVQARLSPDGTEFDDAVILLPEERPPVRVALAIRNETLREDVEAALRATGRATVADAHGGLKPSAPLDLVITDGVAPNDGWSLAINATKGASAFVGPYVIDRTHPLTPGLALDGVIWGASRGALDGEPVVLVGAQALVADQRAGDAHRLGLRFDPAISNLQRTPAWPAFWWNLLEWRGAHIPGTRAANVVLGSEARVTLRASNTRVTVTAPDGTKRTNAAVDGNVVIATTQPGIWSVAADRERYRFAVNALAPDESDLRRAKSGAWGQWSESALTANGYGDAAWLAIVAALLLLALHQRVTAAVPA